MIHTCLKIRPRDTDFVLGSNSPIVFKAVSSGDWTSHAQFFERQKYAYESNGCVCFSAQEDFDAQIDLLLNSQSAEFRATIAAMGYMATGRDGQLHFQSSPRFLQILTGNGFNGNSLPEPWDVIRKYGVLPFRDLPFDETISQKDYIALGSITPATYQKAAQFLALIGGKNSVQYHWIIKP